MHGIKVNEVISGTRAIAPASLSIIGLIATATTAAGAGEAVLNADFPLNTPVLVTNIRAALAKAGTGGTLLPALTAIADQTNPVVVVVRVADPAADETTIGTAAAYSGVHALLAAEAQLGFRPRIIGAPGLDTQAVTTALVSVAKKLRAMVYAAADAETIAEAVTYRENFSARELMLLWPGTSSAFAGDAVARALGLRAAIDEATGWHKTLSNVGIEGVTGLNQAIFFDIMDGDTDAGALNDGDITTLVRSNGFRFWGNRTCSDEPLFAFESVVRTSHALQDEIANGLTWAIDKPITKSLIKDMRETVNARFRALQAQGRIIGGQAWFDDAVNTPAEMAAGRLTIDYDFTPCAPAELITLNQRITDRYYVDLFAN